MPEVHTVQMDSGATIAYEEHGDGRPLVLVHGITDSRRAWDPLIPLLVDDHRVVLVDQRGHGESSRTPPYDLAVFANDLWEVQGALDIGAEGVLVGHSFGGAVVTAYAASYPTAGVVNVDQPLAFGGFQAVLRQLEPSLNGDEATFHQTVTSFLDGMWGPLPAEETERITGQRRLDQEVMLGIWSVVLESSADELDRLARALAGAVTVPYLALHGSDPGEGYRVWLADVMPSATVEVWPDQGHYPHLVDPQRFADRLREFEAALTP